MSSLWTQGGGNERDQLLHLIESKQSVRAYLIFCPVSGFLKTWVNLSLRKFFEKFLFSALSIDGHMMVAAWSCSHVKGTAQGIESKGHTLRRLRGSNTGWMDWLGSMPSCVEPTTGVEMGLVYQRFHLHLRGEAW